ncbi:MAG: hypothetical protein IKO85_05005 [Bacteroidaceae bacterium]|nr:hypothetical protein [Bacteroidaceae bacterium]
MAQLTILSALKAQVQYPLPDDFYSLTVMRRGLTGDASCTAEILQSSAFKGATADCIRQILRHPQSISEGGMSITKASREDLLNEANRLYREIGEESLDERPTITCY